MSALIQNVPDVFITEELAKRSPKKADYLQEKRALQELAARMVDEPEAVLPRFVDLAMEMTGGVSGGLSLYEGKDTNVFRWRCLRGLLAPFEGSTTPRDDSPCGVTLDNNGPTLSLHPERAYSWIADAKIEAPELLLVPLYLGGAEPLGTLWILAAAEGHFDQGHARAMTELAGFVGAALCILERQRRLRMALAEQERLTNETSHRIKNLFMMVDSIVRTTARTAPSKEEMAAAISGRVQALAEAHALVRGDNHNGTVERRTELSALVRAVVAPHESDRQPRFSIKGPPIECGNQAADNVALVIHELATNAVKYGALKTDQGRVELRWQNSDGVVKLQWRERGGPLLKGNPRKQGYGSRLIKGAVTMQFGGSLDYRWQPEGLELTITAPAGNLLH